MRGAKIGGPFAYAAVGVAILEPDGRVVQANRCLADMLGYTEAELRTATIAELTHEEEARLVRKDGSAAWVLNSCAPLPDGTLLAVVHDVSRWRARHDAQLAALSDACFAMSRPIGVQETLQVITDAAARVTGAQRAPARVAHHSDTESALTATVGDPDVVGDSARADVVARENRPLRAPGLLAAPLTAWDGANLGLIHVADRFEGDFTDADENMLVQLAQIASAAIESSRQFAGEHLITEALQRNLLPQRLPAVDAIELAARYVPAAAGDRVGGDWCDVIPLASGDVGMVIGDVAGHGARAAAMMGQVRNAVRAYALEHTAPSPVLAGVSEFLPRLDSSDMVTLIYLVFEPRTGVVRYARAGHPPPLVIAGDGHARYLNGRGAVPLGVSAHVVYEEHRDRLQPGATLLLYTDGLVEDPGESLREGLARLAHAAEDSPTELEALCDHVLTAVGRSAERDDAALLAARYRAMTSTPLRLEVAAHATTLAPLRLTLERWLRAAGADERECFEIIVACSEASANAIEHAYGPGEASFTVEVSLEDRTVVIVVRDHGRWRPPRGQNRGRGQRLMAALMDDAATVAGQDGTVVRMVRRLEGAGDAPAA